MTHIWSGSIDALEGFVPDFPNQPYHPTMSCVRMRIEALTSELKSACPDRHRAPHFPTTLFGPLLKRPVALKVYFRLKCVNKIMCWHCSVLWGLFHLKWRRLHDKNNNARGTYRSMAEATHAWSDANHNTNFRKIGHAQVVQPISKFTAGLIYASKFCLNICEINCFRLLT